jgi:hypothetical protein
MEVIYLLFGCLLVIALFTYLIIHDEDRGNLPEHKHKHS